MPTLEEKIVLTREGRDAADQAFVDALQAARDAGWSWSQLAKASGLSITGVRYHILDLNTRRKEARKGEENGRKRKG